MNGFLLYLPLLLSHSPFFTFFLALSVDRMKKNSTSMSFRRVYALSLDEEHYIDNHIIPFNETLDGDLKIPIFIFMVLKSQLPN